VITMEMMGRVRRMKLRDGLSNSEIAKRTGLSRNTVKKWLKAAGDETPKYKRTTGKATLPTDLAAHVMGFMSVALEHAFRREFEFARFDLQQGDVTALVDYHHVDLAVTVTAGIGLRPVDAVKQIEGVWQIGRELPQHVHFDVLPR